MAERISFSLATENGLRKKAGIRLGDNQLAALFLVAGRKGLKPNALFQLIVGQPLRPTNLSAAVREFVMGSLLAEWEGSSYEIAALKNSRKIASTVFGLDSEGVKHRTNLSLTTMEWAALRNISKLLELPPVSEDDYEEGDLKVNRVVQYVDSTRPRTGEERMTRAICVREFILENLIELTTTERIEIARKKLLPKQAAKRSGVWPRDATERTIIDTIVELARRLKKTGTIPNTPISRTKLSDISIGHIAKQGLAMLLETKFPGVKIPPETIQGWARVLDVTNGVKTLQAPPKLRQVIPQATERKKKRDLNSYPERRDTRENHPAGLRSWIAAL